MVKKLYETAKKIIPGIYTQMRIKKYLMSL